MELYHFSNNANITKFKHTMPKRNYSQATGKGVYFTTDFNKGYMKYGVRSEFCYYCNYAGDLKHVLNLYEYDAMYFNGDLVHLGDVIVENYKYGQTRGFVKEPQIQLERLTLSAFRWLQRRDIQAITGMDYWGYVCPEFCLIDDESDLIDILQVIKL